MAKSKIAALLATVAFTFVLHPSICSAQDQQAQPQTRSIWIARFTCDLKAASAVASIQSADAAALQYSSLFANVTSFTSNPTQPSGAWKLTAKEIDFSSGSAATRALVGWGAGRAHITMEYTLYNPEKKAVWTQKITTKPSFWGAAGAVGAVQDQGKAMDEQGQKLVNSLAKFFTSPTKKST